MRIRAYFRSFIKVEDDFDGLDLPHGNRGVKENCMQWAVCWCIWLGLYRFSFEVMRLVQIDFAYEDDPKVDAKNLWLIFELKLKYKSF